MINYQIVINLVISPPIIHIAGEVLYINFKFAYKFSHTLLDTSSTNRALILLAYLP